VAQFARLRVERWVKFARLFELLAAQRGARRQAVAEGGRGDWRRGAKAKGQIRRSSIYELSEVSKVEGMATEETSVIRQTR